MRKRAQYFLLLFSVVGAVASFEALVRLYSTSFMQYHVEMTRYALRLKTSANNPRIGHIHQSNKSAVLMGVDVNINSDGLRDDEYPVARNPKRRFVFLGDSLLFGWGVKREETFEYLLEQRLNAHTPTEVLNFGTGNYGTSQEVNLFFTKGVKYAPDSVVMFWFINDAEITPQPSRFEFLANSVGLTFLWARMQGLLSRRRGNNFLDFYKNLYEDSQPGWQAARQAWKELASYCAKEGIEFKVVLLPELHNLTQYPFHEIHEKVKRELAELGVPSLDLSSGFSNESDPTKLWVARDDAHPNAYAQKRIADLSFAFIRGNLSHVP